MLLVKFQHTLTLILDKVNIKLFGKSFAREGTREIKMQEGRWKSG